MSAVCPLRVNKLTDPRDRILLELSLNEESLWTYFDAHHNLIMETMRETYDVAVNAIEGVDCATTCATLETEWET